MCRKDESILSRGVVDRRDSSARRPSDALGKIFRAWMIGRIVYEQMTNTYIVCFIHCILLCIARPVARRCTATATDGMKHEEAKDPRSVSAYMSYEHTHTIGISRWLAGRLAFEAGAAAANATK